MPAVITAHNLTKQFGNFTAVDAVSFEVNPGEIVGYLGPNGSGKTTTMRMLLGLLLPTSGTAQVLGYDIVRQTEQIRQRVGYMSQKFSLYNELTVAENLRFYAGIYGVRDGGRVGEVLALLGLTSQANEQVNALSTGWRQRLALGIAIVHRPGLLFLDEPTSGVDPAARRAFWDLIYTLVEGGVTALVTTHYMDEAEYCGRVGIMRDGKLLALATPSQLKQTTLPGPVWEIFTPHLLAGLAALENSPLVLRVRLAGDHLSAISQPGLQAVDLVSVFSAAGLSAPRIQPVEATLEDVFLALAAAK